MKISEAIGVLYDLNRSWAGVIRRAKSNRDLIDAFDKLVDAACLYLDTIKPLVLSELNSEQAQAKADRLLREISHGVTQLNEGFLEIGHALQNPELLAQCPAEERTAIEQMAGDVILQIQIADIGQPDVRTAVQLQQFVKLGSDAADFELAHRMVYGEGNRGEHLLSESDTEQDDAPPAVDYSDADAEEDVSDRCENVLRNLPEFSKKTCDELLEELIRTDRNTGGFFNNSKDEVARRELAQRLLDHDPDSEAKFQITNNELNLIYSGKYELEYAAHKKLSMIGNKVEIFELDQAKPK